MKEDSFKLVTEDGARLHVHAWLPDAGSSPLKAIVQIAHGMAETAARYAHLASVLTERQYAVYANDHRGHGQTAGHPELVGYPGKDGFRQMTDDMAALTDRLAALHPDVPLILLGHSMGGFLAQQYMYRHADKIAGVILLGTDGKKGLPLRAGYQLARIEALLRGERHRSTRLDKLTFGAYNRAFRPNRTPFDWLTRDEEQVDKYIADPYCGAVFTSGFYRDFFHGLIQIHRTENLRRIPLRLPVLILSGEADPVGRNGRGIRQLARMYHALGMTEVSWKAYPECRHELLNETNRDEVIADMVQWLEQTVNTRQKMLTKK